MTDFDPDQFEDKYVHYFTELQRAYKAAFDVMNERRDSAIVHAIDQQILSESEPFYEPGAQSFRIELPDEPYDRLEDVVVQQDRFDSILEEYVGELKTALEAEFLE